MICFFQNLALPTCSPAHPLPAELKFIIKPLKLKAFLKSKKSRFDKFVLTFLHKTAWLYKFLIFALI